MPKVTKICKVCGCEYPYCKTASKPGVIRYQDVACCPEHAVQYFNEVERIRAGITEDAASEDEDIVVEEPKKKRAKKNKVEE